MEGACHRPASSIPPSFHPVFSQERRYSGCRSMEQVQGRAALEPFELGGAIGVVQRQRLRRAIGVLHDARDGFPWGQLSESDQADAVVLPEVVVVRRIGERERQQALFLEVALMD